ncbi:metallophosphoesterase [Aquimarina sp. RZ0]|uniref:metallophosphoesterase n=1 Tax=Aquimarina sp. RZ0 TaxID=2607730 RepID=UPI0011F170DA|nr:metallophosphoesterase [Aquimarina sp. RZ0]KAA1243965.1 phosphoesterase [Aquimarina sp. RZ0]
MNKNILIVILIVASLCNSCALYTPQYLNENFPEKLPNKQIEKSFYLLGDAGGANLNESTQGLEVLRDIIHKEETNDDYLLFLGDNIYQKGMPDKNDSERTVSEHRIDVQIAVADKFNGNVVFIPGNHDWYANGVKGLKRQEKYIQKKLKNKQSFLPSKGCPIESIEVNKQIQLIILDTQWYLANWNKNPTINDNCEIKTREKFLNELGGELKKHNGKTIVVAMHHPMFTNGIHGGKFSFKSHIFPLKKKIPLPILGSLATQILSQGGVSPQDRYNERYNKLMRRLITISRENERIIFASGHEHSLQYIDNKGLKQIVSGSGSKVTAASLGNDGLFSYPGQGVAVLDIFTDGSSNVRFYGREQGVSKLVYQKEVHKKPEEYDTEGLTNSFKTETSASIYRKEETEKSKFFKTLWGDHYRQVYGTDIKIPVATLDTLMGGFTIERRGGGQVTRSLRLLDKEGKRYSLRAMRKSVTQFLQKGAFKDTYLEDSFDDTLTEELLSDFYTSSYPYAFLIVGGLADAIDVYHANPKVYYIPKHPALGNYNKDFGDEIYFLEERPGKEHKSVASFGTPDDIEGTDDLIKNLRKDEEYQMDEEHYIRTRLFDMLLGDWDRHSDQWRWSRFDTDEGKFYRPVPKDRDQVFSNYDGGLLGLIKFIVPITRKFQVYDEKLKNIRWINEAGIRLDRAFTQKSGKRIWLEQASFIKDNLSDASIDKAFNNLPSELQDDTVERIKKFLRSRRDILEDIAERYYKYLSKQVIIKGTDKDDFFEIVRQDDQTQITISRIKTTTVKKPFYKRTIVSKETKEIWIYGLDEDDQFVVKGEGKNPILIRIVGGQNNDVYTIENGKKVRVYDHKSKSNTVKKKGTAKFILSDNYSHNVYDMNKYIDRTNTLTPLIGFNPDDGFNVNVTDAYTIRGFNNAPYQSKHIIKAAYYFATEGYDASYTGEFVNAIGNWNLTVGGKYTSENYAQNFFGFGNNSINNDTIVGLDFNRVKTSIWSLSIGLIKKSFYGSDFSITGSYEGVEVQDSQERFITSGLEMVVADSDFFNRKFFTGIDIKYAYKSFDNGANPTRGMIFTLHGGSKVNINNTDNTFGYVRPRLGFYNAITKNRKLVLKTAVNAQFIIGDGFEFYQAATLGGANSLRGFREERFTGDKAAVFSADLRYSFNRFKTGLLPLQLGVFGGYDYGRVWFDEEDSDRWHDSIGGGVWINAVDALSGQLGLFHSTDGLRFTFGLGINL